MGLVASQCRMLMLYARKSDVEFRIQGITQQILMMSGLQSNLAMTQANIMNGMIGADDNGKLQAQSQEKQVEAQQLQIQTYEKYLTQQQKTLETQLNAVTTEIESVQKIISKNIEMTFKYMA